MNIIYASSTCSAEKVATLQKMQMAEKISPAQKYNGLMIEGLKENGLNITAVSAIPTNRTDSKKTKYKREVEKVSDVEFIYLPFINFPYLRQKTLHKNAKKEIKKLIKHFNNDCVIICDILNQSISTAALKVGKKYNVPVLGIVTDVPGHRAGAKQKELNFIKRCISNYAQKKNIKNMVKYDAYLFLTEAMNDVVNKYSRPYIVIEGQSDAKMADRENALVDKTIPKVLLYAGSIHKEYGIKRLTQAFLNSNVSGWELHIYGNGNYDKELRQIAEENETIKFFGVVSNDEIVDKEIEASLLVNPRPTDADFVKYSFPSKTMEYMASGTPLLTTKLPGMPKEYNDYVYLFEGESIEDMLDKLCEVLSFSAEEMHGKGTLAKKFILEEKNNVIQAKKLIEFIKSL